MSGTNVLLIDFDSKIPNLALMKISTYHKAKGDTVGFNTADPDKIYISCIFKKNRAKVNSAKFMLKLQYPNAEFDIGGCGYDLEKKLPEEIDTCMPDYDLYAGMDYDLGFTTRGCIRQCPFCIVRKKEGKFHIYRHPSEFHREDHKKIVFMDNNILCDKDWFYKVTDWVIENDMKADFNQGLDVRLMDEGVAKRLAELKPIETWHFAFDSLEYGDKVKKCIEMLQANGIKTAHKIFFYVYCDTSDGEYGFDSALQRCRLLKEWGAMPYVMLNRDVKPTKRMMDLKHWANCPYYFFPYDFDEYVDWIHKHPDKIEAKPLDEEG